MKRLAQGVRAGFLGGAAAGAGVGLVYGILCNVFWILRVQNAPPAGFAMIPVLVALFASNVVGGLLYGLLYFLVYPILPGRPGPGQSVLLALTLWAAMLVLIPRSPDSLFFQATPLGVLAASASIVSTLVIGVAVGAMCREFLASSSSTSTPAPTS